MELVEKLKWRYATKAMNGHKVSKEKIPSYFFLKPHLLLHPFE